MSEPPLALLRVCSLPFGDLDRLGASGCLPAVERLLATQAILEAEVTPLCDALFAAAGEREETAEDSQAARRRLDVVALRRAIHNRRTPPARLLDSVRQHLTAELLTRLARHLEGRRQEADDLAAYRRAFASDLTRARANLLEMARRPIFEEGLRLVSRSLHERLKTMPAEPSRWRHGERHAANKLTSYAARFATKTSPNSVFCATALARIGDASVAGENRPSRVDVLLSIAETRKVSSCLGLAPEVWPAIVPRPNPTLRKSDGLWSFWSPASPRNPTDDEVLSRTREQPVLDLFLELAGREELSVPQLLAAVSAGSGVDEDELGAFFEQLVGKGLLIAEVEPPYNVRNPLAFLAETLRSAGCAPRWLPEIEAIEQEVAGLGGLGSVVRIEAMDRIEERLSALPHNRPLAGDELFRLDTASALEVSLPMQVIDDLRLPLSRYARLFASLYPETGLRSEWAKPFLDRYPPDTEVALLDLIHGLFKPAVHERPAAFPEPPRGEDAVAESPAVALARVRDHLAARAAAALAAGEDEVRLTDSDWQVLIDGYPEPSWSAGVLFQIAARSTEEIAAGSYRIVVSALFSGAGLALSRFAHLHGSGSQDDPIVREIRHGWERLSRPGAIQAEITYTHLGRTANAGLRPQIFRHEIELLGEKASPGARVIPLRDLVVRFDGSTRRFVLRSLALGCEVIPIINSGINPDGFVSFLVDVGRQGLQPLAHFPGFDVPGVSHWPRFVCGRVVLFRERWIFPPDRMPQVAAETAGPEEGAARFFLEVVRWRRENRLPRRVFVHTDKAPKPFFIDLESPPFVELLRRFLAEGEGATLHVVEMLPGPDELWVSDARGRYAAELLVHFASPC